MAQFVYKVITPQGKEKKGSLEAKSRDAAMSMLKQDKNVVLSCEEGVGLKTPIDIMSKGKKIQPRDFALFCQNGRWRPGNPRCYYRSNSRAARRSRCSVAMPCL